MLDELELREHALPPKEDWDKAVSRAGALFGLVVPQTLNATNVAKLVEGVVTKARELRPMIDSFTTNLAQKIQAHVPSGTDTRRLKTAQSANALLASLTNADPGSVVDILAKATVETSEAAMHQTLGRAKSLDEAIRTASWQLFEAVASLSDHRKAAAQAIINRIAEILAADEHAIGLKPALDEQQGKALKLLTDVPVPPPPPPPSLACTGRSRCEAIRSKGPRSRKGEGGLDGNWGGTEQG